MRVSVIIPTYNQSERLVLTLSSLKHQDCNYSQFEVIVIDDGSTDNTAQVACEFVAPFQYRYIYQPNRGRAAARNHGVQVAKGEFVLFNDSDRALAPDFIKQHMKMHDRHTNRIVIGSIQEFYFSNLNARHRALIDDMANGFREYARLAREFPYARTVRQMYTEDGSTDYHIPWISFFSGNVSLHKTLFEQAGAFDEAFMDWGFEHFELGLRLYELGGTYYYATHAINYHFAHQREQDFYVSRLRSSFEYFRRKHPKLAVELLAPFLRGEISLQTYEARVSGKPERTTDNAGIYFTRPIQF